MEPAFKKILDEYNHLTSDMSSGGSFDMAKLGKRHAELAPVVDRIKNYESRIKELADNQNLLNDPSDEIKSMALDEGRRLEAEIINLKSEIEDDLLPKDPNVDKNCIVEIRAGAGGDESTLFAAEIFRAYGKFAESFKFKPYIMSSSRSDAGGFKEVIFEIHGKGGAEGPYSKFKFESGVHRVQRVPDTEKSGRVHTSTVTVAVLPELEEKDYSIDP
ncbi:MAG: PCRF domain-containing protein, partial [Patescibacteria group bacterium]